MVIFKAPRIMVSHFLYESMVRNFTNGRTHQAFLRYICTILPNWIYFFSEPSRF